MQISVLKTRVGVNFGDHGQDVVTAVEVGPEETVGQVVERLLVETDWRGRPLPDEWNNYLTIRLVKPRAPEAQEPDETPAF